MVGVEYRREARPPALAEAAELFVHRARDPRRSVPQAIAIRILADREVSPCLRDRSKEIEAAVAQ